MGNDLYVGTLTRYLRGDWESVAARRARELGLQHVVIRPGDPGDESAPPEHELRTICEGWVRSLVDHELVPRAWDEARSDWKASRPDRGWEELVGWARNHEGDGDDALPFLTSGVEWWLPGEFVAIFRVTDPTSNPRTIGSARALLLDLERLNELSWNASDDTIATWRSGGGNPAQYAFAVTRELAQASWDLDLPLILDY